MPKVTTLPHGQPIARAWSTSLTQSYFLFFSDMTMYLETQPRLGVEMGVGSFSEGVIFKLVCKCRPFPEMRQKGGGNGHP